eukprot:TRINITY_DN104_c2_g1_i1.p1 TRINITY_DN104_c2_g1~~TRINITY_DN104_c2_g1_i1.p1  ORF type:complete len:598 (+),score=276.24 TRINITY_DN104_c2_g1_i1:208-2001(+)
MSFWRSFGFHAASAVDNILERESFSLEDLLDEDEVVQETKTMNKKLLDFLLQPQVLKRLFDYISIDSEDDDPKKRTKFPSMACEILSSEVWPICEAITSNVEYMRILFQFLDSKHTLNSILVSYCCRVAGVILHRKLTETVDFVKSQHNVVESFILQLNNTAVLDFLLKLISSEDTAEGQGTGVVQWLCDQHLVPALVDKLSADVEPEIYENVAQALVDIIGTNTNYNNVPNTSPILAQLESEEIVVKIFQFTLTENCLPCLQHGLNILTELLKRTINCAHYNTELESLPPLLRVMLTNYLARFNSLLLSPALSPTCVMNTTTGTLQPPVGFYRLKVIEFFTALIRTNFRVVNEHLIQHDVISTCLKLFFDYPWNNFLHSLIEQMIQIIIEGDDSIAELRTSLFTKSNLVEKIIQANDENTQQLSRPKGMRRGYMGHLSNIVQLIFKACQQNENINAILSENQGWRNYLDGPYAEQQLLENTQLGGPRPSAYENQQDEEDDIEGDDKGNAELVHAFTQYLTHGFTSEFQEEYGNDDIEYDDDQNINYDTNQGYDHSYATNEGMGDDSGNYHGGQVEEINDPEQDLQNHDDQIDPGQQ